MYVIPYEADFECPKGHRFVASVPAMSSWCESRCPRCYEEWIAANVPMARQVSKPREKPVGVARF